MHGGASVAYVSLYEPGRMAQVEIDAWLVPPHNPPRQKRAADRRSRAMRLSALFEEFAQYLKVERGALGASNTRATSVTSRTLRRIRSEGQSVLGPLPSRLTVTPSL